MKKPKPVSTFAAVDIGSNKIAVCVGQNLSDDSTRIVGCARNPSSGVQRGIVIDIDRTIAEIEATIKEASSNVKEPVSSTVVNLNGSHLVCMNVTGSAASHKGEVTEKQVKNALSTAQAVNLDAGKVMLHVLPQQYIVDNQHGIVQPLGQAGKRLDAHVHLVMASSNATQNLRKCIAKCKLPNLHLLASPLASANAVLDQDSRELGVCVIDIGHDTTGVVMFVAGELKHTSVLNWGGRHVNQDIAKSLFTPPFAAARLKEMHGSVAGHESDLSEIVVPGVNGQPDTSITKSALAQIIRAVYERIFLEIIDDFERFNLTEELASSRIVLTGGGSKVRNLAYFASEMLGREAYVEQPKLRLDTRNGHANGNSATEQMLVADGVDLRLLEDSSMATAVGLARQRVVSRIKTHQAAISKTPGVTSKTTRSVFRWLGANV